MKVIVITADSKFSVEEIESMPLDYLQSKVGGWVQAIDFRGQLSGFTLWINEEGKLVGLPYNALASRLWDLSFGQFTDVIVGDSVITGGTDDEGETLGLTDEQVATLTEILEDALAVI